MSIKTKAVANTFFFIATIIVNYLATSLPLGGRTTGELADMYPSLFVPAGFTFSIWGFIYLLLGGYIIHQLIDALKKKPLGFTEKIGLWFIISSLANMGWILAWHYTYVGLSVLIMLLLLTSLIIISKKVEIGKKIGSWKDKIWIQTPFAVYLGRISVATIANISAYLVHIGRNMRGMTDVFWTSIVIGVAMLLAVIALYKEYNIPYALVILWAFYGIVSKRIEVDPVYASHIIWTIALCSLIITGCIGWRWKKRLKN